MGEAASSPVSQWRMCGNVGPFGSWEGSWLTGTPSKNDRWEAQTTLERGKRTNPEARVWLEFRTVTYSPTRVEDI